MSEHTNKKSFLEKRGGVVHGTAAVLLASVILAACEKGDMHDEERDGQSQVSMSEVTTQGVLEMPDFVPTNLNIDRIVRKAYGDETAIVNDLANRKIVTFGFENGGIVAKDIASNLSSGDTDLAPIEASIMQNQEGLMAANRAGTLDEIAFEFDPLLSYNDSSDGYPVFFAANTNIDTGGTAIDTIKYSFPTRGTFDSKNIASMVGHESIHSLVQRLGLIDRSPTEISSGEIIAVDMDHYARLCTSLRDIAVKETLPHAGKSIAAVESMSGLVSADYQTIFQNVIRSMRDGTFGQYQAKQDEAYDSWESIMQSCVVDDPWQVIVRQSKAQGLPRPPLLNDATLENLYADMRDEWDKALADHSLYESIRENTYAKPGSQKNDGMGHPYDNANELIASLINIAINFPDKLRENLERLPIDQQSLLNELVKLVSGDIKRIHGEESPDFVDTLNEAVKKVTG